MIDKEKFLKYLKENKYRIYGGQEVIQDDLSITKLINLINSGEFDIEEENINNQIWRYFRTILK